MLDLQAADGSSLYCTLQSLEPVKPFDAHPLPTLAVSFSILLFHRIPPCLDSPLHYHTSFVFFTKAFGPHYTDWCSLISGKHTDKRCSAPYWLTAWVASPEPNPGYGERSPPPPRNPESNDKQPLRHPHSSSFTPVRKSNSAEHQLSPVLCALWLVPKLNTYVNPMPLLSGLNRDQDTQRFWSFPSVYPLSSGYFPGSLSSSYRDWLQPLYPHPGNQMWHQRSSGMAICPCHANVYAMWAGEGQARRRVSQASNPKHQHPKPYIPPTDTTQDQDGLLLLEKTRN